MFCKLCEVLKIDPSLQPRHPWRFAKHPVLRRSFINPKDFTQFTKHFAPDGNS